MSPAYQARVDRAKFAAAGRWPSILVASGVDASCLSKSNRPCPLCGGTDRFSFTDKFGNGNYFCRGCGAGDGFDLLGRFLGCSFHEALKRVEEACGLVVAESKSSRERGKSHDRDNEHEMAAMLKTWSQAHPIVEGDAVWTYLLGRGIDPAECGPELRCHEALPYYDEDHADGVLYPVMLGRVTNAQGCVINMHRTYLSEGKKAAVDSPKKLMRGPIKGACVQLARPVTKLAVAEGIETALAVQQHTGLPTWATMGAGNMKALEQLPESVEEVWIYADNDQNFAGQAGAFELAHKLTVKGLKVNVMIPPRSGDWLDVWSGN